MIMGNKLYKPEQNTYVFVQKNAKVRLLNEPAKLQFFFESGSSPVFKFTGKGNAQKRPFFLFVLNVSKRE